MKLADIDLLNPDVYLHGLPHEQFAFLRQNAPCHFQENDEPGMIAGAWLVTRYDDVKAVNKNADDFTNVMGDTPRLSGPTLKGNGRPGMTSLDGAEHTRNRRLASMHFTRRAVGAFETAWRRLSGSIAEEAIAKGSFDFVKEVAVELPMRVIFDLMNVPGEDRLELLGWANAIAAPMDPDYSPSPESQISAVHGIWDYGLRLAKLRTAEPGQDIISALTGETTGDQYTDEEMMGFILLLIGAGNETTRNALTHGLHALARHPEQMRWLRSHADDIPDSAVEEILRYSSPVNFMRRTAGRDLEMHGSQIKAGDPVLMMYGSANFDPAQFDEPLELDLQRKPNAHLTFGFGTHFCLGAFVARLELKLLLEEFLRRTSDVRLDAEPVYGRDCYFRPVKTLMMTVTPR